MAVTEAVPETIEKREAHQDQNETDHQDLPPVPVYMVREPIFSRRWMYRTGATAIVFLAVGIGLIEYGGNEYDQRTRPATEELQTLNQRAGRLIILAENLDPDNPEAGINDVIQGAEGIQTGIAEVADEFGIDVAPVTVEPCAEDVFDRSGLRSEMAATSWCQE